MIQNQMLTLKDTLVTSQIISKVFFFIPAIIPHNGGGTCFAYNKENSDTVYLITAKHIVSNDVKEIILYRDNAFNKVNVEVTCCNTSDVAVMKTNIRQNIGSIELNGNVIVSQQVFFLGFPFFNQPITYPSEPINSNYPIPMVKSAIVSGTRSPGICYLDAHNNPGFSGGPVVINQQNKMTVCAIISGYVNHHGQIISAPEGKPAKNSDDQELFYRENSGIAIAHSIKSATDILANI